jgi:hypothetical protein
MRVLKKAVVILVPSLLFGVGNKAWSASTDQAAPTNAQVAPADTSSPGLLDMLNTILTNSTPAPAVPQHNCRASRLYSAHDVVGDPATCDMARYGLGQTATPAIAP